MPPSNSIAKAPLNQSMRRGLQPPPAAAAPLGLQRSEFEDFMNAYRPTLDVPRREPEPKPQEDTSKVDFGRSIKKLMKRPQSSPRNNRKEGGIQRTPTASTAASGGGPPHLERERSVISDIRPTPTTSLEKKPKRPLSAHVESGLAAPPPAFNQGPTVMMPLDANLANAAPPPPPRGIPKPAKIVEESPKIESQVPVVVVPVPANVPNQNLPKKKVSVQQQQQQQQLQIQQQQLQIQQQQLQIQQQQQQQQLQPTIQQEKRRSATELLPYVDAHCLIISGSYIGRFLPPRHNPDPILSMRVVPIPERKYHVIMEFEESPEPSKPRTSTSGMVVVEPEEEFGSGSATNQRESFAWIRDSRLASTGMLLGNVERCTEFPYVTYLVVSGGRHELATKMSYVRERPIPPQQQQLHFLAGYEEAVTVSRPPLTAFPEHPASDKSGFVISLYQVNQGEDGLRFEQNWVMWTGARQLYRKVPEHMGLKRISVHKSLLPTQVINYALICEFSNIMDYLTDACVIIDHLRARCCGFIGIYRILDAL